MALQTPINNTATNVRGNRSNPIEAAQTETKPEVVNDQEKDRNIVTFTSGDSEVFEIPDLPENLGRATALAGENNLRKIWGSEQEAQTYQDMFGEK